MEESHCRNKIIKIPVQASDLRAEQAGGRTDSLTYQGYISPQGLTESASSSTPQALPHQDPALRKRRHCARRRRAEQADS